MYSSSVTIKTATGQDMVGVIDAAIKAAQPTVGDLLYAGQRQRSRILERTAHGVDFEERTFHPYSTKGPFYFYPGKNAKNRSAAANRFGKKIGLKGGLRSGKVARIRFFATATRTKLGIKFSSYAAFKSFLGRSFVDLMGAFAPHMLQAIIVKAGGVSIAEGEVVETSNDAPANEIILAIYGDEAERAEGHNVGARHLPQRKFMGASESDKQAVLNDLTSRAAIRVRRLLGGGQ